MRFNNVCIESLGFTLAPEVVTSDQIESELAGVYERLSLPPGRLEMMSGVHQRRLWPVGTRISTPSVESADRAIEVAGVDRKDIGCLIHASVCREYLEPATASRVHHLLGLPSDCWVFDVSNACLGLLNGVVQIATAIEAGLIKSGIVVGTESSRSLLEGTIAMLKSRSDLTRQSIKPSFASLTIGSGSCAILLVDRRISRTGNSLHSAIAEANTVHHDLCHSDSDQAGSAMQPLMETDSEQLLLAGVATGKSAFERWLVEAQWNRSEVKKSVCHQVGSAHRKLMLQTLELPAENDYPTFAWQGNTGSVALPVALSVGLQQKFMSPTDSVGLLGIGSGINSVMLGVEFPQPLIGGDLDAPAREFLQAHPILATDSGSQVASASPSPNLASVGTSGVVPAPNLSLGLGVSSSSTAHAKPPHIARGDYKRADESSLSDIPNS